ncbi:MAG: hypothetical protein WCA17_13500 [Burkholderiales bacterium]
MQTSQLPAVGAVLGACLVMNQGRLLQNQNIGLVAERRDTENVLSLREDTARKENYLCLAW